MPHRAGADPPPPARRKVSLAVAWIVGHIAVPPAVVLSANHLPSAPGGSSSWSWSPVLFSLALPDTMRFPWIDGWAPALATPWMPLAITAVWAVAASAFMLGLRTRSAGAALCVAALLTLITDRQLYSNHLYLLILLALLLSIADAGAALSLDPASKPHRVRATGPDLIRIHVTLVYTYAALWKLNSEFLSGWVIETAVRDGIVPFPAALQTPAVFAWLAGMTVVLELFVAFGLWSRAIRSLAATIGVTLHVFFVLFISLPGELVVFGLLMLGRYPLFFARDDAQPARPATSHSNPYTTRSFRRWNRKQARTILTACADCCPSPCCSPPRQPRSRHSRRAPE